MKVVYREPLDRLLASALGDTRFGPPSLVGIPLDVDIWHVLTVRARLTLRGESGRRLLAMLKNRSARRQP